MAFCSLYFWAAVNSLMKIFKLKFQYDKSDILVLYLCVYWRVLSHINNQWKSAIISKVVFLPLCCSHVWWNQVHENVVTRSRPDDIISDTFPHLLLFSFALNRGSWPLTPCGSQVTVSPWTLSSAWAVAASNSKLNAAEEEEEESNVWRGARCSKLCISNFIYCGYV